MRCIQRGAHQFTSPITRIKAGTSTPRTTVASMSTASAMLKPSDLMSTTELSAKAREMALVIEAQSLAERDVPDYVVADGTSKVTFNRVPTLDEEPYPVRTEPNLVIEFYSR